MKTSGLFFLACFIALFVNNARAQFRADSSGCPIPEGDTGGTFDGRRIPEHADVEQRRSPDGKKMIYQGDGTGWIIDLATCERKRITISTQNPFETIVTSGYVWCPYDPEVVLLTAWSAIDTPFYHASIYSNLLYYNIATGQSTRMTPAIWGPAGYSGRLLASAWSNNSRPGNDSLIIFYGYSPTQPGFFDGLYVPQSQILKPEENPARTIRLLASTSDSVHSVSVHYDTVPAGGAAKLYFDQQLLNFGVPLDTNTTGIRGASFTPDGKWVAYWVFPNGWGPPDTIFDQVWICSTDKPSDIRYVINFQRLYCMYSFMGIYPEFSSDSNLVVSMHKDGDSVSALYEIGFDGHIVRRLTYVHSSGVSKSDRRTTPFTISPDPADGTIWIRGGTREAVAIYDATGHEVRRLQNFGGETPIDCRSLPAGTYYVRSANHSAKFVIMR